MKFKMYFVICEWTDLVKIFVINRCLCLQLQILL